MEFHISISAISGEYNHTLTTKNATQALDFLKNNDHEGASTLIQMSFEGASTEKGYALLKAIIEEFGK